MKKVLSALVFAIIVIQFYRPCKNFSQPNEKDFIVYEHAPQEIQHLLKKACYDCHSNHANYRWYDNIAPLSWIVDATIKRAKLSLNFSRWEEMEPWQRRLFLQGAIIYDITTDRMPPERYLRFHPEARLDEQAKGKIKAWLERLDMMKE